MHTRYGYGSEAQTTALVKSSLGPVTMLKAELDEKVENLVHLTWKAPAKTTVKVSNNNTKGTKLPGADPNLTQR